MAFGPKNFDTMLEQDVREDIITPLLHRLGYEQGTTNDIIRGQHLTLRYDREFLGRQKPKTDPVLTGYADYILIVGNKIRWVIEAKPPVGQISTADVGQAYSYAKHPEVAAVCYCLCNGREFRVYRTDYAPESALVLSVAYEEFEEQFDTIANVLSPVGISRTWPEVAIDAGRPLGPGLRSIARIAGGHFGYLESNELHPLMRDLIFTVTGGAIERNQDGKLTAFVTTLSPLASAQRLNERLSTDKMNLTSDDEIVSTDASTPTVLRSSSTFAIPEGETVLNYRFPQTILCRTDTIAKGHLEGSVFKGKFEVVMSFSGIRMPASGAFEIYII
jgi:hypothetical protein